MISSGDGGADRTQAPTAAGYESRKGQRRRCTPSTTRRGSRTTASGRHLVGVSGSDDKADNNRDAGSAGAWTW